MPSGKPKLTTARYAERYEAEQILQMRRYCDAFGQWRSCEDKRCRRGRACHGEAKACLRRALETVPREVQRRARSDILETTPGNIGGPERAVRGFMPLDFYDGSADRFAVAEMKRLRQTRTLIHGGDNAHTLRLRLIDA